MKTLYIFLFTLVSFGAVAQTNFTGDVTFVTTNQELDETAQVTWTHGNGMNKMVFNTITKGLPTQYTLIFSDTDINMTMLAEANGSKKKYTLPAVASANKALAMAYKAVDTGIDQNVAGYTARKYVLEQPGVTTTCYVGNVPNLSIKDLPTILKQGINAALIENNINGLALTINTIDSKTGETRFSQTVQSINPRTVNAAEFAIGPEWLAQ